MDSMLIPPAFLVRMAFPCPRVDDQPRSSGRMIDLPEACRIDGPAAWSGNQPAADVRVAWNPRGLLVTVELTGRVGPILDGKGALDNSDGLHLWIDTRDTREVHRATRFCHRFFVEVLPLARGKGLDAVVKLIPIARAAGEPPSLKAGSTRARAERIVGGWRLEVFLGAEALNGFDPETNSRPGFTYRVTSTGAPDQFLGVGREFPVGEDPSLWSTLELQGVS